MEERPAAPRPQTAMELKKVLEAERKGIPFLMFRDAEGEHALQSLEALDSAVTIGRRETNTVACPWDNEVSRVHAELRSIGGEWLIEDEGLSRNGTLLNGKRLNGRQRLHDGDTIQVGQTALLFRDPSTVSQTGTLGVAAPNLVLDLTATQRRILIALCLPSLEAGKPAAPATNRGIADSVHLSVDAVKGHLRVLFTKFDIGELPQNQKRAKLVELAVDSGAVSSRDLRDT